jgi:hypothetical protein
MKIRFQKVNAIPYVQEGPKTGIPTNIQFGLEVVDQTVKLTNNGDIPIVVEMKDLPYNVRRRINKKVTTSTNKQ